MTDLRGRIGRLPQLQMEGEAPIPPERMDGWNLRCNEYHGFCNLAMPLYEDRLGRVADYVPHTLHGLAAKASIIRSEYLSSSGDEGPAAKAVRSVFQDIASIMGEDG